MRRQIFSDSGRPTAGQVLAKGPTKGRHSDRPKRRKTAKDDRRRVRLVTLRPLRVDSLPDDMPFRLPHGRHSGVCARHVERLPTLRPSNSYEAFYNFAIAYAMDA